MTGLSGRMMRALKKNNAQRFMIRFRARKPSKENGYTWYIILIDSRVRSTRYVIAVCSTYLSWIQQQQYVAQLLYNIIVAPSRHI